MPSPRSRTLRMVPALSSRARPLSVLIPAPLKRQAVERVNIRCGMESLELPKKLPGDRNEALHLALVRWRADAAGVDEHSVMLGHLRAGLIDCGVP